MHICDTSPLDERGSAVSLSVSDIRWGAAMRFWGSTIYNVISPKKHGLPEHPGTVCLKAV